MRVAKDFTSLVRAYWLVGRARSAFRKKIYREGGDDSLLQLRLTPMV